MRKKRYADHLTSCQRLDKACSPSTSKRRLRCDNVRAGRVAKQPSDTLRIERKLDDLASLLSSRGTNPSIESRNDALGKQAVAEVTDTEAETSLAIFNAHMLKFSPYIYIPPGVTARQLRETRPFLILCMTAIATRQPGRQRECFDMLREQLGQRLIVNMEPSMDILLGLLTVLGW